MTSFVTLIIFLAGALAGAGVMWLLARARMSRSKADDDMLHKHIDMAQEQLKNATFDFLNRRADDMSRTNRKEVDTVLEPLRHNIAEMKAAMDASRDLSVRNAAAMQQAIADVMQRTAGIGEEADKLARALRHENKTQGNWGEMILTELLESQGLKQGIHYDVQSTITDRHGRPVLGDGTDKRMIPDVILHYSDKKDLIIDSKVSLSAFVDYMGAADESAQAEALDRHVKSLAAHVRELVAKDYKRYVLPPRRSLDYVIMFVPNESALQLALNARPALWRDALRDGVFISGEYNLTAALRIIHLAWRQEMQAQNQRKVFDEAGLLLARVGEFYKAYQDLGARLDAATKAYAEVDRKLVSGRQSLMVPARRLRDMGAKEKERFPLPEPDEIDPDNPELT